MRIRAKKLHLGIAAAYWLFVAANLFFELHQVGLQRQHGQTMCGLEFGNVMLMTLPWSYAATLIRAALIGLSYVIVQRPPWEYLPALGFANELLFVFVILICASLNSVMLYRFLRSRPTV